MANLYKHKLAIFCKTCIRDLECFKLLLESISKFNKDSIPVCISISKKEQEIIVPFVENYNLNIKIFIDEEISDYKIQPTHDKEFNDWMPQQFVKLDLYKTNFAEHYLIIDSDCYFIKDFFQSDFLYNDETPYLPITDHTKAERISLSLLYDKTDNTPIDDFLGIKYKSISIDMPFILTSDYMKKFEEYLKNRNTNFQDILNISPYEMQWYLEWVLSQQLPYMPCSALFLPIHIETQYQIFRWLGFDEEVIKQNYMGIVMNKGHVKSTKYKPLWIGQNIIRRLIRYHHKHTVGRYDYKKRLPLFSVIKTDTHKVFSILFIRIRIRRHK